MSIRAIALSLVVFACTFVGGFAVTYDWDTYHEVKQMRQARGADYTLYDVLIHDRYALP